jgi:arylsulfatase A-like enzyme
MWICCSGAVAGDRPNVLFILVDDMGYGDVGFNGCQDIPTPHIDSIAQNGVRFTDGYVTAPQCGPSRAGLMTGVSQSRFEREDNFIIDKEGLPLNLKTFGDYMREAGYRTGAIGKWHLGDEEGFHPLDRGFEYFYGFLPGSSYYYPRENQTFLPNIMENREPRRVKNYLTSVLGEQAVKFVQKKSDRPFFLYLAHYAPHGPLQAPKEYVERFEHLAESGGTTCRYAREFIPNARQIYAAMVSALDDTVGDLLKALREQGLEENTLIYFLSDNGGQTDGTTACNGPFRGQKGDVLEGGLRVPFAVQWKGTIPAGQTLNTPVSSLDLLPTSLAAAGASIAKTLDGMDLLPLLIDGNELPSRSLLCRFPFPPWHHRSLWMIRRGDMKLVYEASRGRGGVGYTGKEGRMGLYRVSDDVGEKEDLSAQYPEVRQQLQEQYDAWAGQLPPEQWMEQPAPKKK